LDGHTFTTTFTECIRKTNKMYKLEAMENRSNNLSWEEINIEAIEASENKKEDEAYDTDDGQSLLDSKSETKKRRNRRGRREAYRPYYQLSEGQRHLREERERMRIVKLREQMRAKGRIIAPYNTTQFLMSDHPDDSFEVSSSFEDESPFHLFSSQSDEDFMNNEFAKDYNIQKLNSLEKMNKEKLLREFMILERKNESLEAKLEGVREREDRERKIRENLQSTETKIVSEQILTFLQEIESLSIENTKLTQENATMKKTMLRNSASSASSDSSSSVSSSSSSGSSDEG